MRNLGSTQARAGEQLLRLLLEVKIKVISWQVIDVYFYELLSNQYKRSFVEMHFDWCYLVEKDLFFGAAVRAGGYKGGCPHPPGKVNLYNMTINPAYIPRGFPFTRGRIYANFSTTKTKERVAEGHIDMRIATVEAKSIKSLF
ncbi:hypothetical protein HF086_015523 [Spodoptera exigua]|uniref:Uncharacterized protein n=1 Tax=Spodoptera exigua TaxID=7107 RepID=A0A922MGD2_SPOEX|nr:hypothetical protein HF086_015523 [Spodoptera exigua]